MTSQPSLFERPLPPFNGDDYQPERDHERLSTQYRAIFRLMQDGQWRTLPQIEQATGYGAASISAQLRHMRKRRFGSHTLNKRYIENGLYEYQLIVNTAAGREKVGR